MMESPLGTLASIAGNLKAREMLSMLVRRETLPSSLCFAGQDGVGKRTTALALARMLCCQKGDDRACPVCSRIERGIHPDVRTISPDGTLLKVDQVRELIRLTRLKPFEADLKFFILEDADLMNREAENALLKTLEEPPPDTYLVLTTSRPDSLLQTTRSRCRLVRFQPLPRDEIESTLQRLSTPEAEVSPRALFANGSIGTALSLDLEEERERLSTAASLFERLIEEGRADFIVSFSKERAKGGRPLPLLIDTLESFMRDAVCLSAGRSHDQLTYPEHATVSGRLAEKLSMRCIPPLFCRLEEIRTGLLRHAAKQLALETMLLDLRSAIRNSEAWRRSYLYRDAP